MKAVILDWSGTIADDRKPVIIAINGILESYGLPTLSDEEFRAQFKLPYSEFFEERLPNTDLAEIEGRYLDFFPGNDAVELISGAEDFLKDCQNAGRKIFALTSVPDHHFHDQARKLGVLDYFDHAYTEAVDKTEIIHKVIEEQRLIPSETAFIGDMVHDIEAGRTGGVVTVAVLTGYDPPERLLATNPDITADDLNSLLQLWQDMKLA